VTPCTCRPVRLRWKKGLVRELRRRRAIQKLGGCCAECGETREQVLEIHHVNCNGNLHRKKVANLTRGCSGKRIRARASSPSAFCV
jgi:hypothetical protein